MHFLVLAAISRSTSDVATQFVPFFPLLSFESVVHLERYKVSKSDKWSFKIVLSIKFLGCLKGVPMVFEESFKEV